MPFADALPVLQDALLFNYGDSSAVYRAADNGDRFPVAAIIRPFVKNEPTTQALIAQSGIPIAPKRGDMIETGALIYAIVDIASDETFWMLSVRLKSKTA